MWLGNPNNPVMFPKNNHQKNCSEQGVSSDFANTHQGKCLTPEKNQAFTQKSHPNMFPQNNQKKCSIIFSVFPIFRSTLWDACVQWNATLGLATSKPRSAAKRRCRATKTTTEEGRSTRPGAVAMDAENRWFSIVFEFSHDLQGFAN